MKLPTDEYEDAYPLWEAFVWCFCVIGLPILAILGGLIWLIVS